MSDLTSDAIKSNLLSTHKPAYDAEDKALGEIIDQIFEKHNDLNEIESEVILATQKHLKEQKKELSQDTKEQDTSIEQDSSIEGDKKEVEARIKGFVREKIKKKLARKFNLGDEESKGLDEEKEGNYSHSMTAASKKNIKTLIKNFTIYEIYQVMNPRRIAGETGQENYRNNLMERGEKVANKYAGGKENALRKFGSKEVEQMKLQAAQYHKGGKKLGREL